jgi:hypothetical protein
MSKKFKKTVEDFKCDYCGKEIKGSGFTNHCPHCLWSKHVDTFPGDREAECDGMMEPVGLIRKGVGYILVHQCQKCGYEKNNMLTADDDFDLAVGIMRKKNEMA